jgi:hypothetical protein
MKNTKIKWSDKEIKNFDNTSLKKAKEILTEKLNFKIAERQSLKSNNKFTDRQVKEDESLSDLTVMRKGIFALPNINELLK